MDPVHLNFSLFSGILTMEEFQHGCILLNKHMGNPLSEEQIRDLAQSLDINKDGNGLSGVHGRNVPRT
jgi:hypothetical protein